MALSDVRCAATRSHEILSFKMKQVIAAAAQHPHVNMHLSSSMPRAKLGLFELRHKQACLNRLKMMEMSE